MAFHMEGGVMVFTPTIEEFRDFPRFISYMEDNGAQRYGAAKVSCVMIIHNAVRNSCYFRSYLLKNGVHVEIMMLLRTLIYLHLFLSS